ncbi:MAG: type II toxin-antitoxin system RelB/DinJ family antitoxin [Clostridia bacterium]|nr:type II toxin-antitoxin system RelB/DinJ family antitoxin [Clostridia bacterium]
MARTSNVFARVEPEIKEQAEAVLNQLGIPMSNAVGMFLRQVVLQRGIPFDMKLPARRPLVLGKMTPEELDAALEEAQTDIDNGNVFTPEEVMAEMERLYGK